MIVNRDWFVTDHRFSQAVLDALDGRVAVLDSDGAIIAVNQMWKKFSAANEAGGHTDGGVGADYLKTENRAIGPECAEAATAGIRSVLERISAQFFLEYPAHLGEGTRWYEMRVTPLHQAQPGAVVVLHVDITQRKEIEAAARSSESRFRIMANAAPVLVWMAGPDKLCTWFNKPWLEFTGRVLDEEVGNGWFDGVHPNERRRCVASYSHSFDAREQFTMEFLLRRRDGKYRWILNTGVPLYGSNREFNGFIGTCIDITERREAEDALRRSEERYRHLFEANPHPMWVVDSETSKFLAVNDAAVARYGYTRGEFLEMTPAAFETAVPGQPSASNGAKRPPSGLQRSGLVQHRWKDGTNRLVEVSSHDLLYGERQARLALALDVTEQRMLEDRVRQSQKMDAVGQLAGGVAHDFNNLVTIISGYSEILLSALPADEGIRNCVKAISDAGERAAVLTKQLLTISRQTVVSPKVLSLNEVARETEQLLRRLVREDVILTLKLDSGLDRIKADSGQMSQIMMNLVANAGDAMPRGGSLVIETKNSLLTRDDVLANPDLKPGRYATLNVTDSGAGMSPEVKARIFEPFFTTKPNGQGSGLGLAAVHGIVRQAGGHVEVTSELGEGTTFRIFLPSVEEENSALKSQEGKPSAKGKETVLLVEDEDGVRGLALLVLQTHGYSVLSAVDGKDALRVAEAHKGRIDLLVTDVVMPNMGGRDLSDALKRKLPDLKILYMSGYTDDAVMRQGISQYDVAFLQKPYTPMTLARKVRQVLDDPLTPGSAS